MEKNYDGQYDNRAFGEAMKHISREKLKSIMGIGPPLPAMPPGNEWDSG